MLAAQSLKTSRMADLPLFFPLTARDRAYGPRAGTGMSWSTFFFKKKGKKKMARFCCWEGHHYVSEPDHSNGPDRDRERRIRRGRDESRKHVSGSAFKEHLFKCYHRQFTIIKWPLINKGKEKNNKFPPIIQCTIRL